MKVSEIIERCNAAMPREVEYMDGEPYGAHNIPSLDMEVTKILYCVTPTQGVKKYFLDNGFDLLISHHPYIAGVPQLIYHTALDCCEGGLNDMWADHLALTDRKHFDKDLGWSGKLPRPTYFRDLMRKVEDFAGDIDGQVYSEGNRLIETVVICSGLGGMVDKLALESGADCYILGEATQAATKMGFKAVIETGHTNSEWQGVRFFKDLFEEERFKGDLYIEGASLEVDKFGNEFYHNKPERKYDGFIGGDVLDYDDESPTEPTWPPPVREEVWTEEDAMEAWKELEDEGLLFDDDAGW